MKKILDTVRRIVDEFRYRSEERECLSAKLPDLVLAPAAETRGDLLVDLPNISNQMVENLAVAKYFSERLQLRPTYYQPNLYMNKWRPPLRVAARLVCRFLKAPRLARNLGLARGLDAAAVTHRDRVAAAHISRQIERSLQRKMDLATFEIEGVKIGKAIYDTYLRVKCAPTIDPVDPRLHELISEAAIVLATTERLFSERNIRFVVLGHCVYVNWNIISDVALKHGAQVIVTFNARFPPIHWVNRHRGLQTIDHTRYREVFASFSQDQQAAALREGEQLIRSRLEGVIDDGIVYMHKSPYAPGGTSTKVLIEPGSLVMMLHAFSDSPHIYGDMVFPDFYEWLRETLSHLRERRTDRSPPVYLKPHPNRFLYEDEFIGQILREFPFARLLDPEINNKELAACKPAAIISVYGTVAAEFTMMEIPVILCGDNPAAAYSFPFLARTADEYFGLVDHAADLQVTEPMLREVYEFMYMHYIRTNSVSFSEYPFKRYKPREVTTGFNCRYRDFAYRDFKALMDRFLASEPPTEAAITI